MRFIQPGATVSVVSAGTSAASALPSNSSRFNMLRVANSVACHVEFGPSGVAATTSSMLLTAGVHYFIAGDNTHFAVIDGGGGAGARVTVTQCNSVN